MGRCSPGACLRSPSSSSPATRWRASWQLWTITNGKAATAFDIGMASGTSPAIAAVGSGYVVAVQTNGNDLWTVTNADIGAATASRLPLSATTSRAWTLSSPLCRRPFDRPLARSPNSFIYSRNSPQPKLLSAMKSANSERKRATNRTSVSSGMSLSKNVSPRTTTFTRSLFEGESLPERRLPASVVNSTTVRAASFCFSKPVMTLTTKPSRCDTVLILSYRLR